MPLIFVEKFKELTWKNKELDFPWKNKNRESSPKHPPIPPLPSISSSKALTRLGLGLESRKQGIGFSMETQEQENISPTPSHLSTATINSGKALTTLGLGLGLGFGFLYFVTPHTLKPLSTAIKVADGALKGTKSIQKLFSPSPSALLSFSKILLKVSFKASKHLSFIKSNPQSFSLLSKRLKAYMGALSLVGYLQFPPAVGNGFVGIGILSIGYKLSKNLMRVLEGFVGIQINSAFQKGVEAVELIVKTAIVTREFSRITNSVRWKEFGEAESKPACVFVRTHDFKSRVCLNFHGIYPFNCCYYYCRHFGKLDYGFPFFQTTLIAEESFQICLSELLCLAIPVHEEIQSYIL